MRGALVSVVGRMRGTTAGTGSRVSPLGHSGSEGQAFTLTAVGLCWWQGGHAWCAVISVPLLASLGRKFYSRPLEEQTEAGDTRRFLRLRSKAGVSARVTCSPFPPPSFAPNLSLCRST